jgi:hypothetical protein
MDKEALINETGQEAAVQEAEQEETDVQQTDQEQETAETETEETRAEETTEEAEVPETTEEEIPEARVRFTERIKQSLPDQELEGDDAYLEAAITHIDTLETYQKENDEANRKVVEVLEQQPEIGSILSDMVQGASFEEALARNIDIESIQPAKGDPDYEKWAKAKADRIKRMEEARGFEKKLVESRKVSLENVATFQKEKGLSDTERTQFTTKINTILTDVLEDGKITPEFLDVMYKGLAFQEAIDTARKQGEIRGKNEAIDQKKATRATQDDGLPTLTSQGPTKPRKADPITTGLENYNKNYRRFGN